MPVLVTPPGEVPTPLLGSSLAIEDLRDTIAACAGTPFPVLLTGESGTGKTVVAQSLHEQSKRRGLLVHAPLTTLPRELAIGGLRGHTKGAFTGAIRDAPGFFEQAQSGTLFLDEIGDASPAVQRALLTLVEAGTVTRVGEFRARRVDVRVIAATNRDLSARMATGRFREDLFYRLAWHEIALPPLRARLDDLPVIVQRILRQVAATLGAPTVTVSPAMMALLAVHRWPGNFRDLERALVHFVLRNRLPAWVTGDTGDWRSGMDDAMRQAEGNVSRAAQLLGKDRRTLHRELRRRRTDTGSGSR